MSQWTDRQSTWQSFWFHKMGQPLAFLAAHSSEPAVPMKLSYLNMNAITCINAWPVCRAHHMPCLVQLHAQALSVAHLLCNLATRTKWIELANHRDSNKYRIQSKLF